MSTIQITNQAEIVEVVKANNPSLIFYKLRQEFIDICRVFEGAHVIDIRRDPEKHIRESTAALTTVLTAPAPAMLTGWYSAMIRSVVIWDYRGQFGHWSGYELEQVRFRVRLRDVPVLRDIYLYTPEDPI
jgi:hypothetical protein